MMENERPSFFSMKKSKGCPLINAGIEQVDYKDLDLLRQFITEKGKILPRRITGISCKSQGRVKKAIKLARHMALLPFVSED